MERASWSVQPATSRPLRLVTYAVLGLFGGLVALLGAILAGLAVRRLAEGDARLLVLLAVIASVGGALATLYVVPALREPDRRPAALAVRFERLDRQWLAISSLAGAAALWFLSRVSPLASLATVGLGAIALVGLLGVAHNEGVLDPETRTLTYGDRTVDLDSVAGLVRYSAGPVALVRVSYEAGAGGPKILLVPTEIADRTPAVVEADGRARADDRRTGAGDGRTG